MNYLNWVRAELNTPAKKIIAILAILLSLGQLQRLQITPTIAFYVHDLVIIGWLGYWLQMRRFRLKLSEQRWYWLLIGLVVLGYVNAVFSQQLQLLAVLQLGRLISYILFGVSIGVEVRKKQISPGFVRYFLLLIAIIVGWLGWLQYFFLPDIRFLSIAGWDDHYYRLVSTQLDPGYAGVLLIIGFWLFHTFHTKIPIRLLISLIFTTTIGFTYSRASYLAFIISLLLAIIIIKQKQIKLTLVASLASLLLLIPVLPQVASEGTNLTRTSTITARTYQLTGYFNWLKPYNLIIGNGLFIQPQEDHQNVSPYNDHANLADNWLVTLISGLGGVGAVLLLILLIQKRQFLLKSPLITTQVAAVLTFGLFNNIFQPFVVIMTLLSLASLADKKTTL